MYTYNKAEVLGNIGADPEIRSFQSGGRVCSLRVATTNSWKDKAGDWQKETHWHSVVIFDEHFIKVAEKHLSKGSKVLVAGSLENRKYEKNGTEHSVTEIVLRPYGGGSLTLIDSKRAED